MSNLDTVFSSMDIFSSSLSEGKTDPSESPISMPLLQLQLLSTHVTNGNLEIVNLLESVMSFELQDMSSIILELSG